jgi:DNA-binding IclR family transcriptional regulator
MQRTLAKVVEKSGLARSTVMAHLKHMKVDGLVEKEELVQGMWVGPRSSTSPRQSSYK